MKLSALAAIPCALLCALASCSTEQTSGQSSDEYRVDASIEALTEAAPDITEAQTEAATEAQTSAPAETTVSAETEAATAATSEAVEENTAQAIDWTGKWECVSITLDGKTYNGDYMGVPLYAMLAVELTGDGTGTMLSPMAGSEIEVKWSADSADTITVSSDDEQLPARMEGDRLVMSSPDDNIDYRFELTDSFSEFDYDEWFESYDYTKYTEAPGDNKDHDSDPNS